MISAKCKVDYFDMFNTMAKHSTIRIPFTMDTTYGWSIQQVDVNNAFLNGILNETAFMSQPFGFEDPSKPNHVCLLKKDICGHKKAAKALFDQLKQAPLEIGFMSYSSYHNLLYRGHGAQLILVLICVDDILITCDYSYVYMSVVAQFNFL